MAEQLELFTLLGETFPALERAEMVTRLSWVLLKAVRLELVEAGKEKL